MTRLKIIPNAFGERPVLKLMFGAMISAAERWRPIHFSDFERGQMDAVRTELDAEYQINHTTSNTSQRQVSLKRFASSSRT